MVEPSDLHLVEECLKGNTKAFEEIIEKYQKPIFNVAFRMVNDYEDAKDITQTVFVKTYQKLKHFNPKYKFFSWLYRMALNETINFIKVKKQHEELSPVLISRAKSPEERYEELELTERVHRGLMALKLNHRVVIILRHLEGLSYEEISYILDIPVKTVKSRLFTARQILRDVLIKQGFVTND